MKEHIWHSRRHLEAREPVFVGEFIVVPGTSDRALVGNGLHPDREAHLQGNQYVLAEEIGATLYLPPNIGSAAVVPSPLLRAVQTARHNFVGMARAYAANILGLKEFSSTEARERLRLWGLDKRTEFVICDGLAETAYKNSANQEDGGNELVAEAYNTTVNAKYKGYQWMLQKGFENDYRSEHPAELVKRALSQVVPIVIGKDVVLSASHQPNLEAITAALTGNLGNDGNEVFENAGGAYGMGGGFELRVYEKDGRIKDAQLKRTKSDPTVLDKELTVDVGVLRWAWTL
ncbi:MAG TPA: hypothetical protein VJI98_01470 [Candidatus Nanoarchaeia archaeon]|nr:hypothetical protein [Candidatus Nanoarchaeia archaeon]